MSELERFRDHARRMATAEHVDHCRAKTPLGRRGWWRWAHPDPACEGCVTDADRALWTRLADEIDAYLTDDEQPTLEGA